MKDLIGDDRASMGYILNRVQKHLKGRDVIVLFESCHPASAYKNTIRGATVIDKSDNIEDFRGVPQFSVWGVGDGFSSIGPIMYIQLKYNFRKWFVNLVEYDSLGKNKPLKQPEEETFEDLSPTTENIGWVWEFFAHHIP
jgi:hypothetical protein